MRDVRGFGGRAAGGGGRGECGERSRAAGRADGGGARRDDTIPERRGSLCTDIHHLTSPDITWHHLLAAHELVEPEHLDGLERLADAHEPHRVGAAGRRARARGLEDEEKEDESGATRAASRRTGSTVTALCVVTGASPPQAGRCQCQRRQVE